MWRLITVQSWILLIKKAEGHLAAYLLNPYYFFKYPNIQNDSLIMDAIIVCVEKFFADDFTKQHQVINVELLKYKKKEGLEDLWPGRDVPRMMTIMIRVNMHSFF